MGIEIRQRDSKEYYYYKMADGSTLYLGTKDKPKAANVRKTYALFLKTKQRIDRDGQIFEKLLNVVNGGGDSKR